MVYKIRNKGFFWTKSGWKNNWHPKNLNAPKHFNPSQTFAIRTRFDHHSFLRMNQQYRNISRHAKQYFYGDKDVEQRFIMHLRNIFHIPYTSETPCHLLKHGGERRLADHLDRDFELVSFNTHPWQFVAYDYANKTLDKQLEDQEVRASGGMTGEDQVMKALDEGIAKTLEARPEGAKLSIDEYTDVLQATLRRYRLDVNMPLNAKDEDGEFKDFQEVRRPFMHPTVGVHTH